MGHQVNFFATPPDIVHLEAAAAKLEPMLVLHDRSSSAEPRVLPSLNHREGAERQLYYFLVRQCDLLSVVTEYVPAQHYWVVDVLRSPVVEFNASYFDDKILRRGRVYYVDGFYGNDGLWVEKATSFRAWAKRVLAATRKALTKYDDGEYIGPDARAWLHRGGGTLARQ